MDCFKTKEEFIDAIIKESGLNASGVWLNVEDKLFYDLAKDFIRVVAYYDPLVIKDQEVIVVNLLKLDTLFKNKLLYQFLNGKTIVDYSFLVIKDEILDSQFDNNKTIREMIIEIIAFVKNKLKFS